MSGEEKGQFGLLGQRRFAPFFITQTLGAFNDNVYKNALVILVTFGIAGLSVDDINYYINLAGGLFILPFFLFSATAGQIAEKYEKARLIRAVKIAEILIMGLGVAGLVLNNLPILFTTLFLLGTQAAVFGPVKYSILPQHLREHELVGGNAWVEAATFLAILLGTMLGGALMARADGATTVGIAIVLFAVLGYLASRWIPPAPAAAPELRINWNPLTETWRNFRFMQTNRTVLLSVLGISWFWLYGAMFLSQLPSYTKTVLGGDETVVTLLLTVFSLGIGIGSLLCERLSGHKVEIGLVPFGSIGLTLFGIDLYFAQPAVAAANVSAGAFLQIAASHRVLWDLFLIGLFGGFYIVPLYALIQTRTEASHRSRVIAGNNILNALFMVVAAVLAILLLQAGLTIPQLLLTTALMNAAVAVFIYTLVPEFLMRFMVWMLINVLYRIRKVGLDQHIPDEGPAVVVCNHVSFVDALILGGNIRRPVRFVMYYKIFRIPVLNFIFRTARAIPIAGAKEDPELMAKAFRDIEAALKAGDVVGIFPEGGLTMDGEMTTFRPGVERVLATTPVPVIPVALRGLWGSLFSRRDNFLKRARLPRRFWSRVEIVAGPPIPAAQASAAVLEAKVRALRGDLA